VSSYVCCLKYSNIKLMADKSHRAELWDSSWRAILWSNVEWSWDIETWAVSPRGAGWLFGSRVTSEVMQWIINFLLNWTLCVDFIDTFFSMQFNHINNLDLVCRAHQLVQEGLKYMFQDKGLVTVSIWIF
jgi:serine/threonine-protein phosphatase 6 catalytic subunit